ncbi:MAG: hypothetical protein ACI9K2_000899 [Myxococcota bacterium]|jgi:hypothetical protein
MDSLVRALPSGPLDIIGDVHGEIDGLVRLLWRLGVDVERRTADRALVFVGDLVDRGPDSGAVVELVQGLVEAGIAFCVAGNHELNLLQGDAKEGNGWFLGHDDGYAPLSRRPFPSKPVTDSDDRSAILEFLATLPVVLERDDLRVVHACWHTPSVAAVPASGDLSTLADDVERRIRDDLRSSGVLARARAELVEFAWLKDPEIPPTRLLPALQAVSMAEQVGNPYRVLTSGLEAPHDLASVFFVGGKWRLVDRVRWWENYDEAPAVVCGHYWRRRTAPDASKRDLWGGVDPHGWAGPRGNVFCVDYSVGRRFAERWSGREDGGFDGALAALRWPERTLMFDDRDDCVPTTGWGGAGATARTS